MLCDLEPSHIRKFSCSLCELAKQSRVWLLSKWITDRALNTFNFCCAGSWWKKKCYQWEGRRGTQITLGSVGEDLNINYTLKYSKLCVCVCVCVSYCRVNLDSQEHEDFQAAQVLQVHRWVIRQQPGQQIREAVKHLVQFTSLWNAITVCISVPSCSHSHLPCNHLIPLTWASPPISSPAPHPLISHSYIYTGSDALFLCQIIKVTLDFMSLLIILNLPCLPVYLPVRHPLK